MLLNIENKDTLGRLSLASGQVDKSYLFIIFGTLVIGFIAFLLFRSKKKILTSKAHNTESVKFTKNSTEPISIPEILSNPETKKPQAINIDNNEENTKTIEPQVNTENSNHEKQRTKVKEQVIVNPFPETIINKPEKEEHSKEKYIGYKPINILAQTEPLNYPYVVMPKTGCVIKFPRKGRSGRKGYKEDEFKIFIEKYFQSNFQIFDDRYILVKNNPKPYEPDFTLIDEKEGINIFLDIEIDEPYEGLNDLNRRKATHYQYADYNRNNAFKNRGWLIIRFAEIQVHQQPDSCCLFIACIIKSISPKFKIPDSLNNATKILQLRQWTKEEAEKWSIEKYREKYLGISSFGITTEGQTLTEIEETELGKDIEKKILDTDIFIPPNTNSIAPILKLERIYSAINSNKFLSFKYMDRQTITKPIRITGRELTAFCYIKNKELTFNIYEISNLNIKDNYYTMKVAGPTIGLDQISNAINTAIYSNRHIRMKYTRSSWTNMSVDLETGELIIDRTEAEESIRTINDVQLSINVLAQEQIEAFNLNSNYISAYCNKREEQRTFRFDRIGEIEILDL
jgi:hypothetical protein